MSKYIIISRLTDEGGKTLKKNASRIKEVNKELKTMGVKVIEQYAVLGNFDFLNIVEAENEKIMAKAVIEMASRGTIKTETFMAIPIDELIKSLE
ncbi:MAG: GYD domain-containing protein [Candidatus Methanoperedenaceae archaeon]|nr:GYD domain-containing protein [Candidatus Methanoperedenaceae archaeon]